MEKNKTRCKSLIWAKSNPWFGYDDFLTWKAYRIHDDLVHKEGVNPRSKNITRRLIKDYILHTKFQMKRYFSMDN